MLEELVQYDKQLFLFLNNLGTPTWDSFWLFITNKFSSIPLYIVLAILFYKSYGFKKTIAVLVTIALLITVTDQLANFFKYGVQRLRPCHDIEVNSLMRLVKQSCGGQFGYFSAHAANSFAVAFFFTKFLNKKIKYIRFLLLSWAVLVAYSRIYIGVHFPLDVISGALIGSVFSWLFAKLYIFATYRFSL
ncbi:phosphatase PAP2 family protein [Cellulophaga sp. HaHaR_3_176]|uniref:phosphatase PAP2 family protein n=1 Tax=Cellulophaga sp. HaHaR_3_176 TaxID=1942464 RepID=UPI001C200E37|nr:phosphatase PAP2 family protein [Cellulophaga sp. HaHaR_3_176]QWX84560.1 phosphatase PAP2 family protein [Cellulophaga sp. HaHaR_3_176]